MMKHFLPPTRPGRRLRLLCGRLLILCTLLGWAAPPTRAQALLAHNTLAQVEKSLTLDFKDESLKTILKRIEKQSGYSFIYTSKSLDAYPRQSLHIEGAPLEAVLKQLFEPLGIHFQIVDDQVVLNTRQSANRHALTLPVLRVPAPLLAQVTVAGRVTDAVGEGIPGVNVLEKGTSTGTITDVEGRYTLNVVGESSVLVFSAVGYMQREVTVGNQTAIDLSLEEDVRALEEVVVVGYGTQQKSDITGALSSVSAKEIEEIPVQNLTQSLQGRAAGVDVAAGSFSPGSVPSIRIRGNRSILASNEPLYVVDGIPLAPGTGLNDFNPLDVQSIEVLKDASATAIYGSRGANGVILVTTKRGSKGGFKVSYDGWVSFDSPLVKQDVMDGGQFAQLRRDAQYNKGTEGYATPYPDPVQDSLIFSGVRGYGDIYSWQSVAAGYQWADRANLVPQMRPTTPEEQARWGVSEVPVYNPDNVRTTDWQDIALRNAITQNHQVSIGGGGENIQALFSGGYLNQEGVNIGQNFTRYNARLSLDMKANEIITVGGAINASLGVQENGPDMYGRALGQLPISVPYDANGEYILNPGGDINIVNPVLDPSNVFSQNRISRFFGSFYGEIRLLKDLRYRINVGPDCRQDRWGFFQGQYSAAQQGNGNEARYEQGQNFTYVVENLLFYDKNFGDHTLGVTLLNSIQEDRSEGSTVRVRNLPYDTQKWYNVGTTDEGAPVSFGSSFAIRRLRSYMGRVNYSFKNRYLLTASARYDGSSVLPSGNKWDVFPSLALAWKMQEEAFLRNVDFVNELKLRLGYGTVGQSSIAPYQTGGTLERSIYLWNETAAYGYVPATIRTPGLRWERSTTTNVGLDFGLFNNRLFGTVEVYRINTNNLLLPRSIPEVSGFPSVLQNIGATRNTGLELSLSSVNLRTLDDFTWETDVIFTTNKEEIVRLSSGAQDDIGNLWFIGQPINQDTRNPTVYYDYQFDGVWQIGQEDEAALYNSVPGDIRVADINGDTTIDANDRVVIGSNRPKWSGSINNRFRYKGFELSFMLYARIGQMISNNAYRMGLGGRYQSLDLDYWTPTNPTNEFPRPIGDVDIQTYGTALRYRNGSFMKVRNISLTYALPASVVTALRGSSISVYANYVNPLLFVFDGYKAGDPEVTNPTDATPSVKSLIFGVRASF
ncbi:TonB-linked outer membrane protein, SusC/RagA family [Catalinimonas alkaloidigena]|uniref:TonB-linked outer membrane protein, SusC/RagA family n=1 Tax=Catalinimonas alkaloidigena TaxID=1075417 RepID=A0A1G9SXD0_9BACT|nr:TonB-dependent receptor [Catalinimonas alkaloidigena]SDM39515.1 TonB-linked outer membrane protein, SusC/RagA family [Catalinimonas alkaloidigena]